MNYSICSSISSCPYSEGSTYLYTSHVSTTLPQPAPLTNTLALVLRDSLLLPRNSYRFKLTVTNSNDRVGFAEVDIQTESLPSSGGIVIEPSQGRPLSTVFHLRALDWTDDLGDAPYLYRLGLRYICSVSWGCEEWLTGLSQDNEFMFVLPDVDSSLSPELLLQVWDSNGAIQEVTRDLDLLASQEPEGTTADLLPSSGNELSSLMQDVQSLVAEGHWVQALAHFSSLLISVNMDHETVICNKSQVLFSPIFQLTDLEFVEFKARALAVFLSLHDSFIPNSQSHFQISLSILQKITNTQYDTGTRLGPTWNEMDVARLVDLLEDVVSLSASFADSGVQSRRGISEEDAATVLRIYEQVISSSLDLSPDVPRVSSSRATRSLAGILPDIGYGLCARQRIGEENVTLHLDNFVALKSSLINLPPSGYVAGGCMGGCSPVEDVRIDFGEELFARYLQWACSDDGRGYCSGLCVISARLDVDIFWQGAAFSSWLKTPILFLSLLNPSDGTPVTAPPTSSQPEWSLPLVAPYADTANLRCVTWNEDSSLWSEESCGEVSVSQTTSRVSCQCSLTGDSFYAVLERCPDGSYGPACNQSKCGILTSVVHVILPPPHQPALKTCGGQSAACHVTVTTGVHARLWTAHVTVTPAGPATGVRMVSHHKNVFR